MSVRDIIFLVVGLSLVEYGIIVASVITANVIDYLAEKKILELKKKYME